MITVVFGQSSGVTGIEPDNSGGGYIIDHAKFGVSSQESNMEKLFYRSPWAKYTDDWTLLFSEEMSISIPAGVEFSICFNPETEELSFSDPSEELTATQWEAIARAPDWLAEDLYNAFRRISYYIIGDWIAEEILNAPDPYVDEVAFCAANIAPTVLEIYTPLDLLLENARYVYSADSVLDYVEIVDYGNSNDDDYYSTAKYRSINASGATVTYEIPKEIYYWYIVHPKLSDEMPTYINPGNGQPADPPTGVFWRTWFWTYADSGYNYLCDSFEDVNFLWSRSTAVDHAVGAVNSWVDNVMNWGAGSERPIQPVRIYVLHCGNCGEYQDIRGAAARTALIPTALTCNIAEDHVWNEFWEDVEEEWIHWDGGSINNPLLYENGWGKTLSAVWNYRGDGYIWNVTDKYSSGVCTLYVDVHDSAGKPADGTEVRVRCVPLWGGFWTTIYGMTNAEGKASFMLGDEKDYFLKVVGPLGGYPAGIGQVLVIEDAVAGQAYYSEITLDGCSPEFAVSEATAFPDPMDVYRMEIEYQVEYETIYGMFFSFNNFMKKEYDSGRVDFFIGNQENYDYYSSGETAEGFAIGDHTTGGYADFTLPTWESWYGVFSARELSSNRPKINLTANVYFDPAAEVESGISNLPGEFSLGHAYPNPFNHETMISFSLPRNEFVDISVYNLAGQKVDTIVKGTMPAGIHIVRWLGACDGHTAASGIYLVRMSAAGNIWSEKVCLLK